MPVPRAFRLAISPQEKGSAARKMRAWIVPLTALAAAWAFPAGTADGYSISNTVTQQIIEHSVCRKVTNALTGGKGLYVPTKYDTEWNNGAKAFLNNVIAGVSLAACLDAASLRFRAAATTYLTRTPVAGNRKTWTFSAWVKRSSVGTGSAQEFFSSGTSSNDWSGIGFNGSDQFWVVRVGPGGGTTQYRTTSAVYRDPSAWMHVVVGFDTPQATGANRVNVFINGAQVSSFSYRLQTPHSTMTKPFSITPWRTVLGVINQPLAATSMVTCPMYTLWTAKPWRHPRSLKQTPIPVNGFPKSTEAPTAPTAFT